jgi:hypothetical protein
MSVEKSRSQAFPIRVSLNPWPFLWAVVGAWMWYGALHLAHII